MKNLRPFKEIQLQWLRLLVLDTDLSARAVQFATYLAVCRYNDKKGKAWPSHARVCQDFGLASEKTIQRLIKELDGKWFDIKCGNGLNHPTEYVPTKATHLAAQELREKEEAEKPDNIVRLSNAKGGHSCPKARTNLSSEPGQKCPPKKEKEKTKEKGACAPDLPNDWQTGDQRRDTLRAECPVRTLMHIALDETAKIEGWNLWLAQNGFPPLEELPVEERDGTRPGFLMPRRWVPSEPEDQDKVRRYLAWAMRLASDAA
ncbi:helix-turn-helix domain-containing protein [uncultured Litoreibacter sp.]|uniref:helix-turn-helix domain-containing protein n=1 Tax=uncultured Litoreibacter sp. TaxID=1392394 RepID=UPI002613899D|nr:helix-turn-helix domain-containing protein [uncultured Litoreibacter sp.]